MTGRQLDLVCVGIVIASLLASVSCDQRKPAPPSQPVEAVPATAPVKPTTQELLTGAQDRVSLKTIPFSVEAPKGWQIKPVAGVMVLEGPSPAGVVRVQISRHGSPIANHADMLIQGAQRQAAAHPDSYTADVRQIGTYKVLETRELGKTIGMPAIDAQGNTVAPSSTSMNWKISIFVPNGRDNDVCELHFVDLTREQYLLDKPLLDKIVASLQYDAKSDTK